jgi:hypothetical protein
MGEGPKGAREVTRGVWGHYALEWGSTDQRKTSELPDKYSENFAVLYLENISHNCEYIRVQRDDVKYMRSRNMKSNIRQDRDAHGAGTGGET